jgi:hypothetical protein
VNCTIDGILHVATSVYLGQVDWEKTASSDETPCPKNVNYEGIWPTVPYQTGDHLATIIRLFEVIRPGFKYYSVMMQDCPQKFVWRVPYGNPK